MTPRTMRELINEELIIDELKQRRAAPWNNNGRISENLSCPELNKLFFLINQGYIKEKFCYQGDIYRIHSQYFALYSAIDKNRDRICGGVEEDGSCMVLPVTEYSDKIVSFSKNPDFTRGIFYNINRSQIAAIIHVNTGQKYGIDCNKLIEVLGLERDIYYDEQEILFPLCREYIIKEYLATPSQFKYYNRKILNSKFFTT